MTFLSTDSNRIFMDLITGLEGLRVPRRAGGRGLLFGLSPALKATGTNPGKGMQAGGRSSTEGRQGSPFAADWSCSRSRCHWC